MGPITTGTSTPLKINRIRNRAAQAVELIAGILFSTGRLAPFRCIFQRAAWTNVVPSAKGSSLTNRPTS
jgi:hypothetical protein